MSRVESKTSARRVRGRARQLAALDLRTRGLTFEAIGSQLGISTQAAHATVSRALARSLVESNAAAGNLRVLELRRLDAMLAALWPLVEAGDVGAINAALRVGERRAKLLGLDASKDDQGSRPLMLLPDIFARPMPKDAKGRPVLSEDTTEYDRDILARVNRVPTTSSP